MRHEWNEASIVAEKIMKKVQQMKDNVNIDCRSLIFNLLHSPNICYIYCVTTT